MARMEPDIGRCWSVPRTGDYAAWIDAELIPGYLAAEGVLARLDMLDRAGLIQFTANGTPRLKCYLAASPGQVPPDVWTDVPPVNSQARERTGYPTQKPLALLDRIIKASSNPGDIVLDPFCGCATALVAAERIGREWVGIDLSPLAVKLVNDRISEDRAATKEAKNNPVIGGSLWGGVNALDAPPVRTDLGDLPNYRTHRHRLLCSGCNRSKGTKTMAEWRAAS